MLQFECVLFKCRSRMIFFILVINFLHYILGGKGKSHVFRRKKVYQAKYTGYRCGFSVRYHTNRPQETDNNIPRTFCLIRHSWPMCSPTPFPKLTFWGYLTLSLVLFTPRFPDPFFLCNPPPQDLAEFWSFSILGSSLFL